MQSGTCHLNVGVKRKVRWVRNDSKIPAVRFHSKNSIIWRCEMRSWRWGWYFQPSFYWIISRNLKQILWHTRQRRRLENNRSAALSCLAPRRSDKWKVPIFILGLYRKRRWNVGQRRWGSNPLISADMCEAPCMAMAPGQRCRRLFRVKDCGRGKPDVTQV